MKLIILLVGMVWTAQIELGYGHDFKPAGCATCTKPSNFYLRNVTQNWFLYGDGLFGRLNGPNDKVMFSCNPNNIIGMNCPGGWKIVMSSIDYPPSKSEMVYSNTLCNTFGGSCSSYWFRSSSASSSSSLTAFWL